tara:strand:+ start:2586 stop:2879 length:294 start_codon:yes stop_codon:yes gene_type:complete
MSDTPTPRTEFEAADSFQGEDAASLGGMWVSVNDYELLLSAHRELEQRLANAIDQRDRAMELVRLGKPTRTDSVGKGKWFNEESALMGEIAKEKEAK